MSSLGSRLPESLKKMLRPMVRWRRNLGRRAETKAYLRSEIARLEKRVEASRKLHEDAVAQRDEARRRGRELLEQSQELHEEAKQQRDTSREKARILIEHNQEVIERTREDLRHERARAAALVRRLNAPDDDWHDQRQLLNAYEQAGLDDLWYFPSGVQNPYLRLLYSRCPEFGLDPRPLVTIDDLDRIDGSAVFHLHWTRLAQLGSETVAEARASTEAFLRPIVDFIGRGGTFVWSVHEALPHDCPFPEVEADMRKRLVEMAHAIHVLHPSTLEEAGHLYEIDPDKVFVVEHPLYEGAYEDYTNRETARRWLGLDEDAVMLLAFGSIRPYKGFDRAVRLLPELRRRTGRDARVLVCGPSPATEDAEELHRLVQQTDGADIADLGVPASAVHILFKAADLAVLPYRAVLNSGVLMLSLTFGVPTIAPRNAVTEDAEGSGLLHLFDAESDDDLLEVMVEAVEKGVRPPVAMPDDYRLRHSPESTAAAFAQHLRTLRDTRSS